MQIPPYEYRTPKYLEGQLRKALNVLCLRDFEVTLEVGVIPPKGFEDCIGNCGAVIHDSDVLQAEIWINTAACKAEDRDPLHALMHEVGHIWLNDRNEEVQCNVLAGLLSQ